MEQQNRSCIQLISFLLLIGLACSLACAAVVAGATAVIGSADLAQPAAEQPAGIAVAEQKFPGVLTDSRCEARHTDSRQNAAGCVRICLQNGSSYALVNGEQKYKLVGDLLQVNQYAGQRVIVAGVLDGKTIKVNSVSLEVPGETK